MDNTENKEVALRRKAIRLTLKGYKPRAILQQLSRSRKGLRKWQQRYGQAGWAGLRSRSRRPHRTPRAHTAQTRAVVLRVRRALQKRAVGLRGHEPCSRSFGSTTSCAQCRPWQRLTGG